MPQALSKCVRPSRVFPSTPSARGRIVDKTRIRCTVKRFKGQSKKNKTNCVPVLIPAETTRVPQEEDWEREIEEFSCRIEKRKEMSNETPYDAEEELKVALCEMCLYSVPCAPQPHQQHYKPSVHHTSPVKWIKHRAHVETDQFANADE